MLTNDYPVYSERDTINSECLYKWLHCTVKEIQFTVYVQMKCSLNCMYVILSHCAHMIMQWLCIAVKNKDCTV